MNPAERSVGKNVIAEQPRFLYNRRQSAAWPAIPWSLGRRHVKGTAASAHPAVFLRINPRTGDNEQ